MRSQPTDHELEIVRAALAAIESDDPLSHEIASDEFVTKTQAFKIAYEYRVHREFAAAVKSGEFKFIITTHRCGPRQFVRICRVKLLSAWCKKARVVKDVALELRIDQAEREQGVSKSAAT